MNDLDFPLYFHWALIVPKTTINSGAAFTGADLFRGYEKERGLDFGDTTLSAMDKFCHPINPDKYNVLAHNKYILGGNVDSSPGTAPNQFSSGIKSYKTITKWVPVRRYIRFDDEDAARPTQDSFYLIFWTNRFGAPPGTTSIAGSARVSTSVRVAFRDAK